MEKSLLAQCFHQALSVNSAPSIVNCSLITEHGGKFYAFAIHAQFEKRENKKERSQTPGKRREKQSEGFYPGFVGCRVAFRNGGDVGATQRRNRGVDS
jgi:hypothetical protein